MKTTRTKTLIAAALISPGRHGREGPGAEQETQQRLHPDDNLGYGEAGCYGGGFSGARQHRALKLGTPKLFNLILDPKEEFPVTVENTWAMSP